MTWRWQLVATAPREPSVFFVDGLKVRFTNLPVVVVVSSSARGRGTKVDGARTHACEGGGENKSGRYSTIHLGVVDAHLPAYALWSSTRCSVPYVVLRVWNCVTVLSYLARTARACRRRRRFGGRVGVSLD